MIEMIRQAPDLVLAILGILLAAKSITVLTPTKIDDKYLGKATKIVNIILKVLNALALNVHRDTNKDA